jgi:hypothetical protein
MPERAATREPVRSHRLRGLAKSESILEIEAVVPQKRPSVFLIDVFLQGCHNLDQTAPYLLEKRNHLVDFGITRQLELRLAGLCRRSPPLN